MFLTMPSGYAIFQKNTWVCADLAAEAIPAFTDAGEFGAGEFTPGKQAGKHQIKECRLVIQGTRGNAEHLHPFRVGKIARNTAHEAHVPGNTGTPCSTSVNPASSRARRVMSSGSDRQAARGHEQIGPCLLDFPDRFGDARHIVRGNDRAHHVTVEVMRLAVRPG